MIVQSYFYHRFLDTKNIIKNKIFVIEKEIFLKILDDETSNKMPTDIIEEAKKSFKNRWEKINWDNYYKDIPFNKKQYLLQENQLQWCHKMYQ